MKLSAHTNLFLAPWRPTHRAVAAVYCHGLPAPHVMLKLSSSAWWTSAPCLAHPRWVMWEDIPACPEPYLAELLVQHYLALSQHASTRPMALLLASALIPCPAASQVDQLWLRQQQHLAEGAALAECQSLMQEAMRGQDRHQKALTASAAAVVHEAGCEFMHAATRHCYYQRGELQLLLRQLRFCAGELRGKSRPVGGQDQQQGTGSVPAVKSDLVGQPCSHL